ncbi:sensor histidine kinase [Ferrimicrobium sp.]|uniref:sensor histidine kinase n=1 Tax=Ferrimicrobium sp. TaxID=2926050 RepID=UPI0026145BF7|nr:sensor histidine kinase [Ferrimicrobium sp.]
MNTFFKLRQSRLWSIPIGTGFVAILALVGAWFEAHPQNHYAGLHLVTQPPLVAFAIPLAAAMSLLFVRRHSTAVFFVTIVAAIGWSVLGQLNGATLVPILVAGFWVAQEHSWRKAALLGLIGTIALWVANGFLGPFGFIGGPGLTMWPEMVAAFALGSVVSARHLWRDEARARQLDAERAREEEIHLIINRERMRIARELHDVVAHTMAMINIQASAAQLLLDSDPSRASEAIAEIRSASKTGLHELRSILAIMRPPGQDEDHGEIVPDLSAIRRLVKDWNQAGVPTSLVVEGEATELPTAVALASFRIVQEALTNVVRHAENPTTIVTLAYTPTSLMIDVHNTTTSPSSTFREGAGTGLVGIQERVRSLSGTFTASPLADGGFRIEAVLPLHTERNRDDQPTFTLSDTGHSGASDADSRR